MTTVSQEIDTCVQATQNWINDLMWRLGWHDRERVYKALLSTLHALRDSLGDREAIYLGAQLPALLRGLYYEGWHPGRRARTGSRARSAFLDALSGSVVKFRFEVHSSVLLCLAEPPAAGAVSCQSIPPTLTHCRVKRASRDHRDLRKHALISSGDGRLPVYTDWGTALVFQAS
ncbi:DUF2267 domain-containing protein [Mesorhizobium atlanticum]